MEICENHPEHLSDFIRLNEEWISHYFQIEEADRQLAANPASVITNGGYIFSAVVDAQVVGVCALFHRGEGIYELARMAVTEASRGQGIGNRLMEHALSRAQELQARKLVLLSNTVLAAAIACYRKHGFQTVSEGPHPVYSRCNIVMERLVAGDSDRA